MSSAHEFQDTVLLQLPVAVLHCLGSARLVGFKGIGCNASYTALSCKHNNSWQRHVHQFRTSAAQFGVCQRCICADFAICASHGHNVVLFTAQPFVGVLSRCSTLINHLFVTSNVTAEASSAATTSSPAEAASSSSNGAPSAAAAAGGRPNIQLPKNFDPAEREQQLYKW
jgi:hypothetical protein